jgi:hypothetical protein
MHDTNAIQTTPTALTIRVLRIAGESIHVDGYDVDYRGDQKHEEKRDVQHVPV